ncbi:MAG: hypothetical protein AB7V42_15765 [Thermoleophilia bacterium]
MGRRAAPPFGVAPPAPGDPFEMDVLGQGRVRAVVEGVDELVQEGVRGLAWRIRLRLPDGSAAEAIARGNARPAFLDPRHTSA